MAWRVFVPKFSIPPGYSMRKDQDFLYLYFSDGGSEEIIAVFSATSVAEECIEEVIREHKGV